MDLFTKGLHACNQRIAITCTQSGSVTPSKSIVTPGLQEIENCHESPPFSHGVSWWTANRQGVGSSPGFFGRDCYKHAAIAVVDACPNVMIVKICTDLVQGA